MAQHSIDLGTLSLVSSCSSLKAEVVSQAFIASSGEGAKDLHEQLTTTALISSTSRRPWITRGKDYQLVVRIWFLQDMVPSTPQRVAEYISQALFDANIWQQFGMRASSKHVADHSTSSGYEFTIFLEHDHVSPASQKQHKLREGVPLHDISPPKGVCSVQLDRILLDLRFSGVRRSKRQMTELTPPEQISSGYSTETEQMMAAEEFSDLETEEQRLDTIPVWHDLQSPLPSYGITPPPRASPFLGRCCTSQPEFVETRNDPFTTSRPLKRNHGDPQTYDSAAASPEPSDYLELLTAALMNTIRRPVKHAHGRAVMASQESARYLSDCFPSLWTPGHLENVSTRAGMLPTISNALSQVCGTNARSESLRGKMAELARRANKSGCIDEGLHKIQPDFRPAISLHLWHAIEAEAVDRISAHKLKSTSVSDLAREHSLRADDDLLDSRIHDSRPLFDAAFDNGEYDSCLGGHILDLEGTTDLRWSSCTSTLKTLPSAYDRGGVAGSEDDQVWPSGPRVAHEGGEESVEDDLSVLGNMDDEMLV